YVAVNSQTAPTLFEVGEGVFTSATSQITRDTIHRTNTGGATAVTWGAGPNFLFLAPSAARLPVLETDGRMTLTGGLNITGGGASVTGNATVTGTMFVNSGLTVTGGGASVTGNGLVTGNMTVSGNVITSPGTGLNQAVVTNQFSPTWGTTGAMEFPSAFKMKWGTGSVTSGSGSVTYAAAFPVATLNVQLTISAGGNSSTQDALILGATTAAGFAVWGSSTTNVAFNWFAVGY
ncbi:MAG: hypothetical protein ACKO0U_07045, partial [Gammaproteobacteria bacterium]